MYDELIEELRLESVNMHYEKTDCQLFAKAADAIEDLENRLNLWRQDKIRRWIPVTERLPEENYNCLVCDDGFVEEGYRNMVGGWYDFHGDRLKFVTHWMPLPQPPESGEA